MRLSQNWFLFEYLSIVFGFCQRDLKLHTLIGKQVCQAFCYLKIQHNGPEFIPLGAALEEVNLKLPAKSEHDIWRLPGALLMMVGVSYLQWHIVQCARLSSFNKWSLYHSGSTTASTLSSFQEDSVYRLKCLVYIYYLHEWSLSFIVKISFEYPIYTFTWTTWRLFGSLLLLYCSAWVWSCEPSKKAWNTTRCFYLKHRCLCEVSPAVVCVRHTSPPPCLVSLFAGIYSAWKMLNPQNL